MPKKNDSWGIEIGSNAIKAIHLVRAGTQVNLVDYEVLPYDKILTTPDLDTDKAIEDTLAKLTSKYQLNKSSVVLSVPGNMAFARFAKLPPVEPKKIPNIVRFEAVQQIPFPIEQVEWDYQIFKKEGMPEVEVGIFAISKERVQQFLSHFQQHDIHIDALTLSPIAAYNGFHFDGGGNNEADSGTIYMDIGTTSTDVVIIDNGGVWLRTLPIGGNNFTEALVKAFKLSYSKAERLKKEASTSKYAKQIFQAMRSVFSDLSQEIQRSLGYYQSVNREVELTKIVGLGSTFRLPGLQKYLKQQLKIDIQCPDGFNEISVDGPEEADFSDSALNLATAYGLAIQGLDLQSVTANLLPKDILQERMWHRKQPWMAAAAACLVVGAVLTGGRYYSASSAYHNSYNQNHSQVEAILASARNYQNKWNQVSTNSNPQAQIDNLNSTLDYRSVIADIYKDISSVIAKTSDPALLQSNGQNINLPRDQQKKAYIDSVKIMYVPSNEPVEASSQNQGMMMMPDIDFDNLQNYGANMAATEETKSIDADFFGKEFKLSTFWKEKSDNNNSNTLLGPKQNKTKVSAKKELTEEGPRLVITISGITPYANASQLLQNIVVDLNNAPSNGPHPYKSVKAQLHRLEDVGDNNSNNSNNNRYNNNRYNNRIDNNNRYGNELNSNKKSDNGIQNTSDIDKLLPKDSLTGKPSKHDKSFTLTWTIQLDKPSMVRNISQKQQASAGKSTRATNAGSFGQTIEQGGS